MFGKYMHRDTCRICGSKNVIKFLELGPTPLANRFLSREDPTEDEPYYPLDIYYCADCGLVQLLDVVPSEEIFNEDYAYFTGASEPMRKHFLSIVDDVQQHYSLTESNLIVDIGCNDGTLLEGFSKKTEAELVGIDPAENVLRAAERKGICTIPEFFNEDCALRLTKEFGEADIIIATNVLAHTDDLNGFVKGLSLFLSKKGMVVIEVPYLKNLIEKLEFDTIYHEHYSYFAVRPLALLFRKYGMVIEDIRGVLVHGGSLRIFVQKGKVGGMSVDEMLMDEWGLGLHLLETYMNFGKRVEVLKSKLVTLLKDLKVGGERITGYGATAKGNTLLNYCGISTDTIDLITDTTPFKQGKYTPGTHIPIYPEERFHEEPPDYALLLAWNYANEIIYKESEYIRKGGHFIIPIPEPQII